MSTKKKETFDFLNTHNLGTLSTVSHDGPWGSAIYFITDEDLNIYFITRAGTKKYANLQQNPQAALTVYDNASQTTVQMAGTVSEVTDEHEQNHAFRYLAAIHPPGETSWTPPVSKIHEGAAVVMRLTPQAVQYADFKSPETHSKEHIKQVL